MRHATRTVLALALVLLTGCALWGIRRPVVSLVDVRLGQVGLTETTLLFDLRIINDNPVGLTIEDGLYDLFVEGEQVGRGRLSEPLVVPRRSSEVRQIALHVDNLRLVQQLRSVLRTGSFDYRVESQHFIRGFGRRAFSSVNEGRFELRDRSAEIQ